MPQHKRHYRRVRRETVWGYFFLTPWIIGFLAFSLGPILGNLYLAFTDYSAFGSPTWVGLENFRVMFSEDRLYFTSLQVTLHYVVLRVPLWLAAGILLALLANQKVPGIALFRTIVYLPTVLPIVASSVIWLWFLHPQVGFVNAFARNTFGVVLPNWLNDLHWAMPALVVIGIWQVGQTMMIFLAGLQDIPNQLYESAEIDGASGLQKFFAITLPMLSPTIYFNAVIAVIGSFQVFGAAFILTQGGPVNRTLFYVLYLYRRAFQHVNLGYASAMSVILFLVVLVLTLILIRTSDRWVKYDRV